MADNKPMVVPMKPHWFVAMALVQTIVYIAKKHHAMIIEGAKMSPPESVFEIASERREFIDRIQRAIHDQVMVMGRSMEQVVRFTFSEVLWTPSEGNRFMMMRIDIAPDPTPQFFTFEIDFRHELRCCVSMFVQDIKQRVNVFNVEYLEE